MKCMIVYVFVLCVYVSPWCRKLCHHPLDEDLIEHDMIGSVVSFEEEGEYDIDHG
jgi:hypothetical protein